MNNKGGIPKYTSILVISLFQSFNILSLYILINGLTNGSNWEISSLQIIGLQCTMLFLDYVRFYRVLSFEKLLQKFEEDENVTKHLHPAIYFIGTLILMVVLRLFNFFPEVV